MLSPKYSTFQKFSLILKADEGFRGLFREHNVSYFDDHAHYNKIKPDKRERAHHGWLWLEFVGIRVEAVVFLAAAVRPAAFLALCPLRHGRVRAASVRRGFRELLRFIIALN